MRLLGALERFSMGYADTVMTVHEPYAAEVRRRTHGRVDPAVVMNSADTHLFRRRQTEPRVGYTVMYHGSLIDRYGVLDLLEAFGRIDAVSPDASLWLLGDGDARKTILARVDSAGLSRRVWVSDGMLPSEQIKDLLPRASLGVIPNQPNLLNMYALSTKLFEYVQTGVPVLCADLPTLRLHFSETELLFFDAGNVDDLAVKLRWAFAHPDEMRQRADAAYTKCQREYAWPEQRRRFLAVLASARKGE
jgi:glycosyltransferase involved in cell wall biosynthesis